MKLDIDLCREILKRVEEEGNVDGLTEFPRFEGFEDQFVFYQIKKMEEAGYVDYKIYAKGSKSEFDYFKLDVSFQGHEFLKHMMDNTIWRKTKTIAKKKGVELTFSVLKYIIPIVLKNLITE